MKTNTGEIWCVFDPILGDNGKGRIVDQLTKCERVKFVFRYNGGANAGHSVVVGDTSIALHLLPSGLVRTLERQMMNYLGRGTIIRLPWIADEINELRKHGIEVSPGNLMISKGAMLTLPYHVAWEKATEQSAGRNDTTCRAISQTAGLHHMYKGLRAGDIIDLKYCREQIKSPLAITNAVLRNIYDHPVITEGEVMEEIEAYRTLILPFLGDESEDIHRRLCDGEIGIAEGAQGGGLCPHNGIYPFTSATSSWPCSIQTGAGVDPCWLTRRIAVIKAYITRVGKEGKTTQMEEDVEQLIRQRGHEFGVTSGRPRTCMWPDDLWGRKCAMLAHPTEIAINKVDILTGINPLRVCTQYNCDGGLLDHIPMTMAELKRCKPVYETFHGWTEDITGIRSWHDLPLEAKNYLRRIAAPYGAPISYVGTGPERSQIIDLLQETVAA